MREKWAFAGIRIFIDTLTDLCKQGDAQLILTIQSVNVAEFVNGSEIMELDGLLESSS